MPTETYIAALVQNTDVEASSLTSLLDVIALVEGLTLERTTDDVIQFSGDPNLVKTVKSHFKDRILIEQDQAITLDDPAPSASVMTDQTPQDSPDDSDDGDDKDPNEIVQF